MKWYLVAPTYKKNGELSSEYREGRISLTAGKSIKFVDDNDATFIRYATLRSEMPRIPEVIEGNDEFYDNVGYILVSGESLRQFITHLDKLNYGLGKFEYLGEDRIIKGPLIRYEVPSPIIEQTSCKPKVNFCLYYVSGSVSCVVYDYALAIKEITQNNLHNNNYTGATGVGYGPIFEKTPKKENKIMNLGTDLFKDLYFGKAPNQFALSLNNQITYNGKYYADGALNDACGLTLDFDGLLYVMPTQEIKAGDIIYKRSFGAFYFDGKEYIDLTTGQKAEYVPVKVFGMTFYSVVKNLAGDMFGTADAKTNPMANMLPFLLLGKNNDSDDLVKFMLLSQGGFNFFQPQPQPKKGK